MSNLPIALSGNVDLVTADIGKLLCATGTTTLTILNDDDGDYIIGDTFRVLRDTTGTVTIAAALGVTIVSLNGNLSISGQYGELFAEKIGVNRWLVFGDLA